MKRVSQPRRWNRYRLTCTANTVEVIPAGIRFRVTRPCATRHAAVSAATEGNEMTTVTDDELLPAMFWLWERMKIVVEPTGALGFAALLHKKVKPRGRVGVVLSGGNVDLHWAAAQLRKH